MATDEQVKAAVLNCLPWSDDMSRAIGLFTLNSCIERDGGTLPSLRVMLSLVEQGVVIKRTRSKGMPRYARSRRWAETQEGLGVQEEGTCKS